MTYEMSDNNKNKVGRPQRYVLWRDWERWVLLEWMPFKGNDLPHIKKSVHGLETDMVWVKCLLGGLILAIVAAAIGILVLGG